MKMYADVYRQILLALPVVPPECGGIIGSSEEDVVTDFYFDAGQSCCEKAIYTPDILKLNRKIADWEKSGIHFQGLVHSHPIHQKNLSQADVLYIETVMSGLQMGSRLYFPIVLPCTEVIPYIAYTSKVGLVIQKRALKIIERSY